MSKYKDDKYFEELCKLAGLETPVDSCGYFELMSQLHRIEFIWSVPNDDNRALDGLSLRERCRGQSNKEPCSLLEMLIALAIRCEEEIMYDPEKGDRSADWFWMMMTNLGLNRFRNGSFKEAWNADDVLGITDILIDREYNWQGNGGLFPLKDVCKDQVEVEIWYQMSAYLLENFPIG